MKLLNKVSHADKDGMAKWTASLDGFGQQRHTKTLVSGMLKNIRVVEARRQGKSAE